MQEPLRRLAAHWGLALAAGSVLAFVVAAIGGIAARSVGAESVLTGDPFLYPERIAQIAAGHLPYVDATMEHLPLAIVPMALAFAVSSASGMSPAVTFAGVSVGMLALGGWAVDRAGRSLDHDAAVGRWLVLVLPLLPLVLFRNDIVAMVAAAIALWGFLADRTRAGFGATLIGIFAKGWPVVFALAEWWKGRRARAAGLVAVTVGLWVALMLTPGFRAGRSFSGIHIETVAGSLILLWRHLAGQPLALATHARAGYVEVGPWAIALEAAIGAVVAAAALGAVRRPFRIGGVPAMLATATVAVLLGSPLLSAQFLLWPTPLLAFSDDRRVLRLWVPMSALTIGYLMFWSPASPWWAIAVVVRNLLLVAVAVVTVAWLRRQTDSTSRRNLPV